MKAALILSLLGVFLLAGCSSTTAQRTSATSKPARTSVKRTTGPSASDTVNAHSRPGKVGQRIIVRTTAYTHTEAGGIKNAVGGRLRYSNVDSSAASDWSWMPIGTRFKMVSTGRTFIIEDYGSALIGRRTVDLYMPNRRLMNQWGCRHVEIEILEWGSARKSLEVLGARRRHRHVRSMVDQLVAQSKGLPDRMHRIEVR